MKTVQPQCIVFHRIFILSQSHRSPSPSLLIMDNHRIAIASISMGWHESHGLFDKASAAAKNGYKGIELVCGDLEKAAASKHQSSRECAASFKKHCESLNLQIISLAPFENFESSPLPLAQRLRTAFEWVEIARIVEAEFIQVPASFDHASLQATEDDVVNDLRLLADCGLPRPGSSERTITFAYEPMSWSVRNDTWQHALYIKHRVGKENFKLCLDTYHILSKLWADCTEPDGKIPGGDFALQMSLRESLRVLKPSDIGFVQLSDAQFMDPPVTFSQLEAAGKHYGWYWSGCGRIFPLEKEHGAYLPMRDIVRTWLVELGWSGWVSMEVFHHSMNEEDRGPEYWAKRGMESWRRVRDDVDRIASKESPKL